MKFLFTLKLAVGFLTKTFLVTTVEQAGISPELSVMVKVIVYGPGLA